MGEKNESIGEFSVFLTLDIGDVSLSNGSITELYFIEDIFSFCITGKMVFTDDRGIFEFGPLTGNEKLTILYGSDDDKEREFFIYKINQSQNTQTSVGTKQVIEMFFVDTMFFAMNYNQWSYSWKNKKISYIINDISKNILGINKWIQFENTKETLDTFYMPYWTPHTAIKWLLKRGTGQKSGESGFLMYNNSLGSNFVTLDTLLNAKSLDPLDYVFTSEDLYYQNKIFQWSISGIDSTSLKELAGGTLYGYNTMEKSFITNTFKYRDSIKKHTILGQKTLFSDNSDIRRLYKNTEETSINKINTIYYNNFNKNYDHQQVLKLIVRGEENKYCGQLIKVIWPSKDDTTQLYNMNLSGYYLVKSIIHYFTGYQSPHYKQKLLCIKNGYEDSDSRDLVKSTKKRIGA